jgi:hypothetical protein
MNHAFSLSTLYKIRCPYNICQNTKLFDKITVTKHLCQNDFMPDYEIWVFHGEKYIVVKEKRGRE